MIAKYFKFKAKKEEPRGDSACLIAEDGTLSNAELHAELLSAVSDDEQARFAAQFLREDVSEEARAMFK